MAQATQAYQPSTSSVQSQIDNLASQLETTNAQINKNYAQQQASLDRSKNQAAETASLQAAGSGGSFGGAANIANRKYYDQSYVPAVTSLQSNQANALQSAKQASDESRTSLQSQLASLQSQANQQALAQYYSDLEAEKQREYEAQQAELDRQASLAAARASASNAAAYYNAAANSSSSSSSSGGLKNWNFGNGYSIQEMGNGQAAYLHNGSYISASQFLSGTAGNTRWDLWNDVWNNGVSTYGVGSDTVESYKRRAAAQSAAQKYRTNGTSNRNNYRSN